MTAIADLYVLLSVQTAQMTAGFERAGVAGEDFTAKLNTSMAEASAATRDLGVTASQSLSAAAEATLRLEAEQQRLAATATEASTAEKGLADTQRLEAEMAATAAESTRMLRDAQMSSVDATLASARAQNTLKDAEIASGDAAVRQAGKTDAAAGAATGAAGHFRMMGLAAAAGAAISIKMAGDYQQSMTRLVTSAGETQKNLQGVSQGLLAMSTATNTSTQQLAAGMYYVESAGFHGAQGLIVMKAAAEGAQAEGAQLQTVANAVTSGLNAYGLSAQHAMQFTNMMVTAVGRGKMTMQDLAGSLSAVLPVAAAAHIGFAQVGGAIATMTSQGMSAQQATQDLAHTIRALQGPNAVAVKEMAQLGLSSTDVSRNLGKRGLTGTIELLEQTVLHNMGPAGMVLLKTFNQSKAAAQDAQIMLRALPPDVQKLGQAYLAGSITQKTFTTDTKNLPPLLYAQAHQFATTAANAFGFNSAIRAGLPGTQTFTGAMGKMLGGATGLNTALMVGGVHMPTFNANVQAISASASQTGKDVANWALIQHNFNFQLGSAEKALKAVAISFGQVLLPAATKVMHAFSDFGQWLTKNSAASKLFAVIIGVLLAGAFEHALVKGLKLSTSGFEDMWKSAQKLTTMLGITRTATEAQAGAEALQAAATDAATAATVAETGALTALQVVLDALGIGLIILAIVGLIAACYELYKHVKLVRDNIADVGHFFAGAWKDAMHIAGQAINAFRNGPLKDISKDFAQVTTWWRQHSQEIRQVTHAVWTGISTDVKISLALISGAVRIYLIPLVTLWKTSWGLIADYVVTVWHLISNTIKVAITVITGVIGVFLDLVTGHWSKAWSDLHATTHKALGQVGSLFSTFAKDCLKLLYDAGRNLITGLINGIFSLVGTLQSTVKNIGHDIVSAFTGSGVSQGMHAAGADAAGQAAAGISDMQSVAYAAANAVGASAKAGLAAGLSGNGNPVRGGVGGTGLSAAAAGAMASVGKAMSDAAVQSFGSGLSGAGGGGNPAGGQGGGLGGATGTAAKAAKAKVNPAIAVMHSIGLQLAAGLIRGLEGTASQVNSAVGKLIADVKAALSAHMIGDPQALRMTAWLEKDNVRLQNLANRRSAILKQIAAAQNYAQTTAANIVKAEDVVTAAGGGTTPATSATILANLTIDLNQVRTFKANIAKLQKMGLNRAYIDQIIQAGPVNGGQIAAELASGSWSQIQQINKVESQIASSATSLGQTAANAMYDNGRNAGKGFLSGLQSQQKSIEDVMKRIARVMVDTIRKELRIHSPSEVMREHGAAVAQGLALGIDDGAGGAAAAAKRLAGAVSGGASGGGSGGAGHGGGNVINLHLTVQGFVGNESQLVSQLFPPLQKLVLEVNRRNPGTGNGLDLTVGRAA